MKVKLILNCFFAFAFLSSPIANAQGYNQPIEISEADGFLSLTVPLLSFQKGDKGSIVVIGEGQLGQASQQFRLEVEPNKSMPRTGVTHTDKSCSLSFDEELFRTLAKHLSVSLPSSSIKLRQHSFDLIEVEGSLDMAATSPVKLEVIDLFDDNFYSEWYITIDLAKKLIWLAEKNNEYRVPFVHTFIR